MPFHPVALKSDHLVLVGETEFAIPEKESEVIKLAIYLAAPKFNEEALHVSQQFIDCLGRFCRVQYRQSELHPRS
jgi:hypothetical protein